MKPVSVFVFFGTSILMSHLLVSCDLSQPLYQDLTTNTPPYGFSEIQLTSTQTPRMVSTNALPTISPPFHSTLWGDDSSSLSPSPIIDFTATTEVFSTNNPDAIQVPIDLGPEGFVKFYYANINDRNYELTWSLLTPEFISLANPPSKGGFQGYVSFWNSVDYVEVTGVDIVTLDKDHATIIISATYHYRSGIVTYSHQRFYLVFDSSRSTWLFN